jgi:hypothetical protein
VGDRQITLPEVAEVLIRPTATTKVERDNQKLVPVLRPFGGALFMRQPSSSRQAGLCIKSDKFV